MANIKSAKKRALQATIRQQRNRSYRSRMRTAIKQLRSAVAEGDQKTAQSLLGGTCSIIDSTAQKGVIHANVAARTKSRLTRAVTALSA